MIPNFLPYYPNYYKLLYRPILLNKKDCIAIAETGSGKTLAFLIPAFSHIFSKTKNLTSPKYPTVMVVSPTRELAQQINQVCIEAGRFCGIKSVCVYGGVNKYE
jgi:ATP-dependent RNA helicase DBP3